METIVLKLGYPFLSIAALTSCVSKEKIVHHLSQPYNIVFIMSDDHTRQMMSCYDKRYIETPNLDRIAKDGVIFRNAFVANSISGPSRACLLTGKHSHKNGKLDNQTAFDSNQQTVQELLQNAGYQTAMVGKWHLDGTPKHFDYWEILPGQGDYYNPDFITSTGKKRHEGYVTDIITDLSLDWLEKEKTTNKPFCIFIHHKAVHRNWMSDSTHLNAYEDKTFALPSNFYDNYEGRIAASQQKMSIDKDMDIVYDLKMMRDSVHTRLSDNYRDIYGRMNEAQRTVWDKHYQPIINAFYASNLHGKELAEWKYQRYMRDYSKVVKSLDENVGRVMDYLEKNGLLENTLVFYTSDQGFYMGEHGWFDKRFMYEESFSTPLIIHLPKSFKKRGDITALVQNIDFAPTMLNLAGAKIPSDIQGVSLLPLLQKERPPRNWRKSLYYHYYEYPGEHAVKRHFGVRTKRYKLIHFYNNIDSWELYDLKKDPHEMHNLYVKNGYERITTTLKAELKHLQEKYEDPILKDYPL